MTTENEIKALEWAVKNLEKWPEKPTKYFGVGFDSTGPSGTRRDLIRLFAFGSGVTVYRDEWVKARMEKNHKLMMDRMWKTVAEVYERTSAQAQALIRDNITPEASSSDKSTETDPPPIKLKIDGDDSISGLVNSVREYLKNNDIAFEEYNTQHDHEAPECWLPPIGIECEVDTNGSSHFEKCTPKYHGLRSSVIEFSRTDDTRREAWVQHEHTVFRAIQSDRDKAIERMLKKCINPGSVISRAICESLYDAGWREPIERALATKIIADTMAYGDVSQQRLAENIADALDIRGPA